MIKQYLESGYPCLYIPTPEHARAVSLISKEVQGYRIRVWDCVRGITENLLEVNADATDPVEALHDLTTSPPRTIMIAMNLHMFMESEVKQAIANGAEQWKQKSQCLIVVSPILTLPPEIEKIFHIIDLPLPNAAEMLKIQEELLRHPDAEGITTDQRAANSAVGLTEFEAETAFARCLAEDGKFNIQKIGEIKGQMIKRSGMMQIWEPADIADVGGLQNAKNWLLARLKAWLPENEHLPKIGGILVVGPPGTGKSLLVKAMAMIFSRLLVRHNLSDMKGGLVGDSERNIREALKIIDAVGESILWWDEIEKSLGGYNNAHTGDTTGSILGTALTWMQERTMGQTIIGATANNPHILPAEFVRRFDKVWFVDLPSYAERLEILEIMCRRYKVDLSHEIKLLVASELQGFTGAEIEKVIKESLFDGIQVAMKSVVPISITMKEQVHNIREWAKTRATLANTPDQAPTERRALAFA